MSCAATPAVGELRPGLPGWIEQLELAIAASGDADEIRLDRGDRIAVAADARERPHVRWAKLLIVAAASLGLASAGVLGANRFLKSKSVSPPPVRSLNAPARMANSSDRHRLIVRAADRATTASVPAAPNHRASTRIGHSKPSRAAVPPTLSAGSYVPPAPPAPATVASTEPPMEVRLTPVPETRPTTIDGWVLREVVNGTAVLEGPDGIWRVKRGDMVPGVGQVVDIFGWGNRMIVATSRGLISTP